MSKFKIYLVGGHCRDEIIGRKSKDLDFVVIAPTFEDLVQAIKEEGGEIFVEKKEFGTVRAKHPKHGVADFALPRLDGVYSDGRRPDSVTFVQSIEADLSRRDSTMNAIAKDADTGEIIDPFNGVQDIKSGIIRAVGNPIERLKEDSLRSLRYIRQSCQLGFIIEHGLDAFLKKQNVKDFSSVSTERILEELTKTFKVKFGITVICYYNWISDLMDERGLWAKPTNEKI